MFPLFPSGVSLRASEKRSQDPAEHRSLTRSLVSEPFLKHSRAMNACCSTEIGRAHV